MFFSGGTFGQESEAREANKRQTGRRHQPRDMTETQTATAGGNAPAAVGAGGGAAVKSGGAERHAGDQKQMSSGPSFMDRMYAHDASATEPAHAARRHKSGPTDNLNIFSWQETDKTQQKPPQVSRGPRAPRNVEATAAVPTVEDRRAVESKKFETHSESTFLKFSDAPEEGQSAPAGAARAGRRVSAPRSKENGMMGELMRDQLQRPHGKRVQVEPSASAKRKGGAAAEDPGVAGFPGMGQRSAPRAVPHLHRQPVQSNVFPPSMPPWAQHDDIAMEEKPRRGGPPAPTAPAVGGGAPTQPSYRLDDADYEDHHRAGGDDVGTYADHQRRMQEIEMYDDGDDEGGYAPAMQHQPPPQQRGDNDGARLQPRWLDEQEGGGSHPGESPSAQQRRYNYNPQEQEFFEDDPDYQDHHQYR